MIERVQRLVSKLVPLVSNIDLKEPLEALCLTTLADRRLRRDAIHMYNFLHDIDEIDKATYFRLFKVRSAGHSIKYYRKISKNKIDTI